MGKPSHGGGTHSCSHHTARSRPSVGLAGTSPPPHNLTRNLQGLRDLGPGITHLLFIPQHLGGGYTGVAGAEPDQGPREEPQKWLRPTVRLPELCWVGPWGLISPSSLHTWELEGSLQVGLASQEEGIKGAEARLVDREGGMGLGECGGRAGETEASRELGSVFTQQTLGGRPRAKSPPRAPCRPQKERQTPSLPAPPPTPASASYVQSSTRPRSWAST